jgi:hypothetical protein
MRFLYMILLTVYCRFSEIYIYIYFYTSCVHELHHLHFNVISTPYIKIKHPMRSLSYRPVLLYGIILKYQVRKSQTKLEKKKLNLESEKVKY